jgi:hypothetical protein
MINQLVYEKYNKVKVKHISTDVGSNPARDVYFYFLPVNYLIGLQKLSSFLPVQMLTKYCKDKQIVSSSTSTA